MRSIYLLTLCTLITMVSCGPKELSDTEMAGIDSVLDVYDGDANYKHGYNLGLNDKNTGRYFHLFLTNSTYLNNYPNDAPFCTPVIAKLFYEQLSPEEKEYYQYYRIELTMKDKQQYNEYSKNDLAHIVQRSKVADDMVTLFVTRNYGALCDQIYVHPDSTFDCLSMFKIYEVMDQDLGKYRNHYPFAMQQGNMTDLDQKFKEFIYMVDFENGNFRIGLTIGDDETSNTMYGFQASPPFYNQ